jgi:hypothetical protein
MVLLNRWERRSAPPLRYVIQFAFEASGGGQQWDTDRPMGFWRNFAAIDLTDTTDALRFVARHGDPFGHLDDNDARLNQLNRHTPEMGRAYGKAARAVPRPNRLPAGGSEPWPALALALDAIAGAWDPLDPNAISFLGDDRDRLEVAQRALYELARPDKEGLPDIEWIAQGRGLVPRARTLRAFMIASAASALRRGVAMKKCAYAHCGDWFELRRTDAFYCSGSCQAADYKQRAMAPGATVLEIAGRKRKGRPHGERA